MSVDVMTNKFGNITLKTTTQRRAPGDEDVAVLSSFLPEYLMSPAAASKNRKFECALKRECRLGDPKATPPGTDETVRGEIARRERRYRIRDVWTCVLLFVISSHPVMPTDVPRKPVRTR